MNGYSNRANAAPTIYWSHLSYATYLHRYGWL